MSDAVDLRGAVAVVTGASRGVGKGIALGLGEAGMTVYVTGRTRAAAQAATPAQAAQPAPTAQAAQAPPGSTSSSMPGSIDETAEEVTRLGGRGIAVACDHADDAQVKALFERVGREQDGRLDVLVNNAFAIPDGKVQGVFWELPIAQWDAMHTVGLRSHFVAAVHAAPLMIARKSGLIVNVSSFGAKVYAVSVAYGVGKAGVDRMSRDMARELKPHGVTCVSIWPGIVETERLLIEPERLGYDATLPNAESPRFSGRAVAALAKDARCIEKSGQALVVAELAEEYGFTDLDGSRPRSLRR